MISFTRLSSRLILRVKGQQRERKALGTRHISVGSVWTMRQLFITAEYPDLWPLAVDELLRVIADLAESVQDFIRAIEFSNPYFQG